IWLKR
ncbi:putative 2-hydroxyacid dehydrogenase, partial [Vibrio parahaemolyticus V-223/04]